MLCLVKGVKNVLFRLYLFNLTATFFGFAILVVAINILGHLKRIKTGEGGGGVSTKNPSKVYWKHKEKF